MAQEIKASEYAGKMLDRLPKGAFLTVKADGKVNTMTVGWGAIGYIWRKPVLIIMVRYSRYTYELMEKSTDFSISVPFEQNLKHELAGVGTHSGRNVDKFKEYKIITAEAKTIKSPVISGCGLVYECRILFKHPMNPSQLDVEVDRRFYSDKDYHMLYYGEILAQYTNA